MYVNMILSEWQMSFETKALGETRLRAISEEMFQGIVGREFWESAREIRLATTQTRRARRFHRILDEEYQHALDSPAQEPPRSRTEVEARVPARRWMWPLLVGLTAGAVAALPILNSVFARHRQRPG
jgi:hypothetical protein